MGSNTPCTKDSRTSRGLEHALHEGQPHQPCGRAGGQVHPEQRERRVLVHLHLAVAEAGPQLGLGHREGLGEVRPACAGIDQQLQ
jgi:hypothetical protein